ncbi:universal stress protein [uncultured Polaribacter sp.]|uniref:universal stress protein n=1 Tax=uncultured Polaribacter sp. TaxID=174711 RepID=UPI00263633DF|nr:universal stress protein [uncultured Polaribacter sp.]
MNSKLIVYPTDFSDCAKNTMPYVIALAKALKSKIRIVHAIEIGSLASAEKNPTILLDTIRLLEEEAKNKLVKLKERIEAFNLECAYDIVRGQTLFLKEYMENLDPLMVIMGTIGNHGIENKIFGSLAAQTIRNTKSIVLTVPKEAKFDNLSEIVFATDFHIKDTTCIRFIKEIIQYYGAGLHIIHISRYFEDLEQEREKLLQLETEVAKMISSENFRFELLYAKDIEDELAALLENSKPDMLVLITRNRNFIERIFEKSLSKKMVNHTHTPVLVFPS